MADDPQTFGVWGYWRDGRLWRIAAYQSRVVDADAEGAACYYSRVITAEKLHALCRRHDVGALYAFGSRAAEVAAFVRGQGPLDSR